MSLVARMLADTPDNNDPVRSLVALNAKYQALYDAAHKEGSTDEDWKLIFRAMYTNGDSKTIKIIAQSLGLSFEYCPPDTTYQDDATAAIIALRELTESIVGTTLTTEREADWFKRHGDYSNPEAFINTNPEYYARECASAVWNGRLVSVDV